MRTSDQALCGSIVCCNVMQCSAMQHADLSLVCIELQLGLAVPALHLVLLPVAFDSQYVSEVC